MENGELSIGRKQITAAWAGFSSSMDPVIHPFVSNWLNQHCLEKASVPGVNELFMALTYLQEHGSTRDKQMAVSALEKFDEKQRAVGRCEKTTKNVWGEKLKLIDCTSEEVAFGLLRFHVVDFGGVLNLNDALQRELDVVILGGKIDVISFPWQPAPNGTYRRGRNVYHLLALSSSSVERYELRKLPTSIKLVAQFRVFY